MNFQVPEKDGIGKASAIVQFIIFLVLFIGIYLILRRFIHSKILRFVILIADYFVVSLLVYTFIKPLAEKLEQAIRNRK